MPDFKSDMLRTIRGQPTTRIPWVPRLDLWYRANRRAGTLPPEARDATEAQVAEILGAGRHAIVPDFKGDPSPDAEADRALGLYHLSCMPCRTVLRDVERRVTTDGDRTLVEYRTPAGTVRTVALYDDSMRAAGITISHVAEYAIKTTEDYAAVAYLFEHAAVEPNYEGYLDYARAVGPAGLAAGFLSLAASPMHLIQRELMPLDRFFFDLYDHPGELAALADSIAVYWNKLFAVAAASPAELFLLGANYDARVTYPPFFADHIQPWLRRFADLLHARGKFLLTHTDGENSGLLEHYVASGIDVADSICPRPMTQLSIAEVRQAFAGQGITIMGGIPSVALLRDSLSDREFDAFLDGFFTDIGRGDHLILGISDTTPPGADFNRLKKIGRRIADFGPVS